VSSDLAAVTTPEREKSMILLTGGAGFLGGAVLTRLLARGEKVRVLALPGDPLARDLPEQAEVCAGDLLNPDDLDRFFALPPGERATLVHCASLITMSMDYVERVQRVNVGGTQALLERCGDPKIAGLVYVSSVHAIPELPMGETMREPTQVRPDGVVGFYANTKAQATRLVMEAREKHGLNAGIAYPAGLCGPGDRAGGFLGQMISDYFAGRIPMGVKGGYNFVDVRDAADAIVEMTLRGQKGEDYVLAGEYISIMQILETLHRHFGGKKVTGRCPLWLARLAQPFLAESSRRRGVKPIFSRYSLKTILSNSSFDTGKARRELGFSPRSIEASLKGTVLWMAEMGMVQLPAPRAGEDARRGN